MGAIQVSSMTIDNDTINLSPSPCVGGAQQI